MRSNYPALHILGIGICISTYSVVHVSTPVTFPETDKLDSTQHHHHLGKEATTMYVCHCHLAHQHFVLYLQYVCPLLL
jgi:hypothetical protein